MKTKIPAYARIRDELRNQILRGELAPGTRLPPEREMARRMGVSRTTIVSAYDELVADGLIEGRVGRGTIVTGPTAWQEGTASSPPMAWPTHFAPFGQRVQARVPDMVARNHSCSRPDAVALCFGVPDTSLVSAERLQAAWEAVIARVGSWVVSSGSKQGGAPLRQIIAARLARRGIAAEPDSVLITNGAHQGLDLLLRLLTEPGDTIVTESPTYLGALEAFRAHGLRVIGVPVDDEGMDIDRLEFLLARQQPRFIFMVPTFQNPTGITLSLPRRERLLALARKYQVPIIEDDPYGELAFDTPPPPLKALDRTGHVLYLGTVSKCFAPGLRIGWLVAPRPVVTQCTYIRHLAELHPSPVTQHMLAEFAQRGWLDEHIALACTTYAARCRAMLSALERHLPRESRWSSPGGGVFVWLQLPEQVRARALLAAAAPRGVVFMPGYHTYPSDPAENTARLNFSVPDEPAIARGIEVLGAVVRQLMRRRPEEEPAEEALLRPVV